MKKNQIRKSNIASTGNKGSSTGNKRSRQFKRFRQQNCSFKSCSEKPARVKAASKNSKRKKEEILPPVILNTFKNLKVICKKIDKLEKQKRKIIMKILDDCPV